MRKAAAEAPASDTYMGEASSSFVTLYGSLDSEACPAGTVVLTNDEVLDDVTALHREPDDIEDGDLVVRVNRHRRYVLMLLPMSLFDGAPEWDVDAGLVDQFAEALQEARCYPAIVYDMKAKSIIDGAHRVEALKKVRAKGVWAFVGGGEPQGKVIA
jgi:hypothetical protein